MVNRSLAPLALGASSFQWGSRTYVMGILNATPDSFSGDGVAGGVVNFLVDSVDTLHAEIVAKGVAIHVAPVDQTWGTREDVSEGRGREQYAVSVLAQAVGNFGRPAVV